MVKTTMSYLNKPHMNKFPTFIIVFLSIILFLLIKDVTNKINFYNSRITQLEDSLSRKIDTFIITRDSLVKDYKISKKQIIKWDTIYKGGIDTTCDSLVVALKTSLKKCDTVVNISDTLIKTLLVRDTVRQQHIQYLKNNNKFSLVVGPGLQVTPAGIQPGFGVTFGFKIK